jgi:hypothetical protein
VALLLLAGCTGKAGDAPGTTARPSAGASTGAAPPTAARSAWDEDLDELVAGIELFHPNPWWRISKRAFVSRVDRLRTTLPTLDATAAAIAVMELVAKIDGHTAVYPTDLGFHYYAIELYEFADGTYVLAAPGHPELVGGRVTGIGGLSLRQVDQLLRPLVSHDNKETTSARLPLYLVMPEALQAKGIVKDPARPGFRITTKGGAAVVANPRALGWDAYRAQVGWFPVGLPQRRKPLSQSRRDETIWSTDLGHGAYYVQYNEVRKGLEPTIQAIEKAVARPGFRRLVVDIRHNGGGDNTTYGPLLQLLTDHRIQGRLSVIIGRETFSAAENFATEVEIGTDAVFVGEPTGGRPNLYGDVRDVVLPRSGIVAHVSSRYWQMGPAHDARPALPPDIPVALTSRDYFAERDPILAAARSAG